ncbi:MAG: hypothetical protein KDA87_02000 [Planctomycetales bacterium]|nr:hypothetical protein [Planctomycetales bacterium]
MTIDAAEIDRIVAEVVRRLQALPSNSDAIAAPVVNLPSESDRSPNRLAASSPNQLVIADRLVTLELLKGRLQGVDTVLVQPNAVVTPAVKDELRLKKIALRSDCGANAVVRSKQALVLRVIRMATSVETSTLQRTANTVGCELKMHDVHSWMETRNAILRWNSQQAKPVLVLTDQPHLAACECNRFDKIRAVYCSAECSWKDVQQQFVPNAIIVRPADNVFEAVLRNLVN